MFHSSVTEIIVNLIERVAEIRIVNVGRDDDELRLFVANMFMTFFVSRT